MGGDGGNIEGYFFRVVHQISANDCQKFGFWFIFGGFKSFTITCCGCGMVHSSSHLQDFKNSSDHKAAFMLQVCFVKFNEYAPSTEKGNYG